MNGFQDSATSEVDATSISIYPDRPNGLLPEKGSAWITIKVGLPGGIRIHRRGVILVINLVDALGVADGLVFYKSE